MTPEQITQWAREVGWPDGWIDADELAAFAALVAAHEREECARVCEGRYMGDNNREDMEARRCAAAIRARTNAAKPPRPLGCGAVTFVGQGGGIRCGEMGYGNKIFLCDRCGK